ncbi:Glycine rich protein [Dioscorea alata]|uniref:Glycine rich protein n=1 Tax=Dioscorea alata TaxID=55571 RepID=A0ACB7VIT7_DIOAL|nr:Glycine rich protein [Dioscorea alata]
MASSKSLFVLTTALLGIILILSLEAVSASELPQQTQEKVDKAGYEEQKTYGSGGLGLLPGGYYNGYGYLPGNGYYNGFRPGYLPGNGYYGGYYNRYPYAPGYVGHP